MYENVLVILEESYYNLKDIKCKNIINNIYNSYKKYLYKNNIKINYDKLIFLRTTFLFTFFYKDDIKILTLVISSLENISKMDEKTISFVNKNIKCIKKLF